MGSNVAQMFRASLPPSQQVVPQQWAPLFVVCFDKFAIARDQQVGKGKYRKLTQANRAPWLQALKSSLSWGEAAAKKQRRR